MYLSYLLIDTGIDPDRPRPGRMWLRNLYRVHQRLCMAFPSDPRKRRDPDFLAPYAPEDFPEQRHLAQVKKTRIDPKVLSHVHSPRSPDTGFLFRVDPHPGGRVVILVQSAIEPDWKYAFQNADYLLAAPVEVKPFDLHCAEGERFQFRLLANPTRKIDTKTGVDGQKRNGRRVPVRNDGLFDWLARRADPSGFSVERETTSVRPGYIYVNGGRDGNGRRMRSARYDGVLQVTDSPRLVETLVRGIGPGKAFGFGLLSVAPVRPDDSEIAM